MNVQEGQTKSKMRGQGIVVPKKLKFKPLTRKGMSLCADHGWQKKGFDSLTGKKKPLKLVIKLYTSILNILNVVSIFITIKNETFNRPHFFAQQK